MNETLITMLLPILGVLLGASLQYFFSRSAESRKQLRLLRAQAYSDYLQGIAKTAHAARQDVAQRAAIFADVTDAKTRIAVFGTTEVIEKLAAF